MSDGNGYYNSLGRWVPNTTLNNVTKENPVQVVESIPKNFIEDITRIHNELSAINNQLQKIEHLLCTISMRMKR
jgi:hypothetical protein